MDALKNTYIYTQMYYIAVFLLSATSILKAIHMCNHVHLLEFAMSFHTNMPTTFLVCVDKAILSLES